MSLRTDLSALKNDRDGCIGPYGRAALILTIKDLFRLLPDRSKGELLDLLVSEHIQSEGEQDEIG